MAVNFETSTPRKLLNTFKKAIDDGQNNGAVPHTNGQFDPFNVRYDKGLSALNFPHKVLLVRGTVRLEPVNGIVPEYAVAAERYFGAEQGKAWVAQLTSMIQDQDMVRITITPEWVGLLDFQTRFPSALPL